MAKLGEHLKHVWVVEKKGRALYLGDCLKDVCRDMPASVPHHIAGHAQLQLGNKLLKEHRHSLPKIGLSYRNIW